jgi:hypothetical protein
VIVAPIDVAVGTTVAPPAGVDGAAVVVAGDVRPAVVVGPAALGAVGLGVDGAVPPNGVIVALGAMVPAGLTVPGAAPVGVPATGVAEPLLAPGAVAAAWAVGVGLGCSPFEPAVGVAPAPVGGGTTVAAAVPFAGVGAGTGSVESLASTWPATIDWSGPSGGTVGGA